MQNKDQILSYREEVQGMFSTGALKDNMEALLFSIKQNQPNEIRLRIDQQLKRPGYGEPELVVEAFFYKNSQSTFEDIDIFCEAIGYGALHVLINDFKWHANENLDSSKVFRFISTLSNTDLDKKRQDEVEFGKTFSGASVDFKDYSLLIALNAKVVDNLMITNFERLYKNLRNREEFWSGYTHLAHSFLSVLELNPEKTQLIANLAKLIKSAPDMVSDNPLYLNTAFTLSMRLSKAALGLPDPMALSDIKNSQDKMASHMLKGLSVKSVKAMGIFGNRNDKVLSSIPDYMLSLLTDVVDSSLKPDIKKELCMLVVKVALEARTTWMPEKAIGEIIEVARKHLDFDSLVGNLNKTGIDNLVVCATYKSDFIHLLKKSHRAKALESGLSL